MVIFAELAYTPRVTEKCDVHGFGPLTLEVQLGVHPGDLISNIHSSTSENTLLIDMLDPCLPIPTSEVEIDIIMVVVVANQMKSWKQTYSLTKYGHFSEK